MASPTTLMICAGSDYGTRYRGEFGGFYRARACPLANLLVDKNEPHFPCTWDRRPWLNPDKAYERWGEDGKRFF